MQGTLCTYHEAVGFAESGGELRSGNAQDETPILTDLTEELESVRKRALNLS